MYWGRCKVQTALRGIGSSQTWSETQFAGRARVYANFMVALLEVHLGEVFSACNVVQQLVNARQRVLVLEGDSVECAVVDAKS